MLLFWAGFNAIGMILNGYIWHKDRTKLSFFCLCLSSFLFGFALGGAYYFEELR